MDRTTHEETSDKALRRLVSVIVRNDTALFSSLIDGHPALATESFSRGATRQDADSCFFKEIGRYIYEGDTALHFAAAAYRDRMAARLMQTGSRVQAKNRRGSEPLHAAAFGGPASENWDPAAQAATIACLIEGGADPNAQNMDGATPLHLAVRSRCAEAVRALLACGADPSIRNRNGSTAMQLTLHSTGRSGSGSTEAKAQLKEILLLLDSGVPHID